MKCEGIKNIKGSKVTEKSLKTFADGVGKLVPHYYRNPKMDQMNFFEWSLPFNRVFLQKKNISRSSGIALILDFKFLKNNTIGSYNIL